MGLPEDEGLLTEDEIKEDRREGARDAFRHLIDQHRDMARIAISGIRSMAPKIPEFTESNREQVDAAINAIQFQLEKAKHALQLKNRFETDRREFEQEEGVVYERLTEIYRERTGKKI